MGMTSDLRKVTMNLSEADVARVNFLQTKMQLRTKADVVATSVLYTKILADLVDDGDILIRHRDGRIEKLILPHLRPR